MIPLNEPTTVETPEEEAAEPQWLQLSAMILPDPNFLMDAGVFQDAFEEFVDAAFGDNSSFTNIYLMPADEDDEQDAEGE